MRQFCGKSGITSSLELSLSTETRSSTAAQPFDRDKTNWRSLAPSKIIDQSIVSEHDLRPELPLARRDGDGRDPAGVRQPDRRRWSSVAHDVKYIEAFGADL